MLVRLPSGAVAPLETPGLMPLLSGGGGTLAVARATLAHEEVDAGDLTEEDRYAVALWGLKAFCTTEAAIDLAEASVAYGEPPSWRLGITEPTLGWELDSGCLEALKTARAEAQGEPDEEPAEGVLIYSVPDTWDGSDD